MSAEGRKCEDEKSSILRGDAVTISHFVFPPLTTQVRLAFDWCFTPIRVTFGEGESWLTLRLRVVFHWRLYWYLKTLPLFRYHFS